LTPKTAFLGLDTRIQENSGGSIHISTFNMLVFSTAVHRREGGVDFFKLLVPAPCVIIRRLISHRTLHSPVYRSRRRIEPRVRADILISR